MRSCSSRLVCVLVATTWIGAGCSDGTNGDDPGNKNDVCAEVTCGGHGTCAKVAGEAVCECESGYQAQGLTCVQDSRTNPCQGVTCSGHGSCEVASATARCNCDAGYRAQALTCVVEGTPVDPCKDVTCTGRGSCVAVGEKATCQCTQPYVASGLECLYPSLDLFTNGANATADKFLLRLAGGSQWGGVDVVPGQLTDLGAVKVQSVSGRGENSALQITWSPSQNGQFYVITPFGAPTVDLSAYPAEAGALSLRVRVDGAPGSDGYVAIRFDSEGGNSELLVHDLLNELDDGQWHELSLPLACYMDGRFDPKRLFSPLTLYALAGAEALALSIEDIRWSANVPDTTADCSRWLKAPDQPELKLYDGGVSPGLRLNGYKCEPCNTETTDNEKKVWSVNLKPGTNHGIWSDKQWIFYDMRAYLVPSGKLKVRFKIADDYGQTDGDILVKLESVYPRVSDLKLFAEILGNRPAAGEWVDVVIPIETLAASPNNLDSGGATVNMQRVGALFQLEAVDRDIRVLLDQISWVK